VLPDADAASGNAYCATLPPGTRLALPDAASARPLRAVAVNEIEHAEPETGNSLPLAAPLKLVSPAYLAARDAHELQLARLALSATTATNH
jgi:hypothetical protein